MAWKFNYITLPENVGQVVFRFLSTLIVRVIAVTPITPNQVTLVRGIVAIFAMWLFAKGDPRSLVWAVVLFYIFEVLDHVDGDLARHTKRFSKVGPLLEQFIDTWASRPSNLFGFCIALGMYRQSGSVSGFLLFGATVFGRIMWLEYRDYFGWVRDSKGDPKSYRTILGAPTLKAKLRGLFEVLYIWNNTFLLLGALFLVPIKAALDIDALIIGFSIVAALNNVPWIVIVTSGFIRALNSR